MSVTAWTLALPIFIMATLALWGAIDNHRKAIELRDDRPNLSSRMCKRSAGAVFLVVAYFPSTVAWLMGQTSGYVPSIPTISTYLWDFCVFLCIFEWVKMSRDEMNEGRNRKPCRPCPFQEDK